MTGQEIFSLIKEKEKERATIFDPTSFIFNPEMAALENEIEELRKQCPHELVDGKCKWCFLEEIK